MRHSLTNINPEARTADCAVCGPVRIAVKQQKSGPGWRCTVKKFQERKIARRPWTAHRKDHCESTTCQWQGPFDPIMLDVDHIDGDKTNNDPSNYQTLCANCHRVKSQTSGDYRNRG